MENINDIYNFFAGIISGLLAVMLGGYFVLIHMPKHKSKKSNAQKVAN